MKIELKNFLKLLLGSIYNYFNNISLFKNETTKYQDMIYEIKNKGFYKIENFIDIDICDKIRNKLDFFLESNSQLINSDPLTSDLRVYGSEYLDEDIKKFNENIFIRKIGHEYLKCEIDCLMTMANRVKFKERNEGSGGGWHRDSIYKQFKSILYLDDVTKNNGPFQLIKDTNKFWCKLSVMNFLKKKISETRFSNQEIENLIDREKFSKTTITGKKGTLILVDTSLIHRGSPLQENQRYALTNYFYSKKTIHLYNNHFNPRIKSYTELSDHV